MPWKTFEEDGRYCVHKLKADESKGEKLKCYDSKSDADDYVKALYANTSEMIQEYTIARLRGSFPDVPIAAGVDLDELKTLDPQPVFVTLPVIPEIGTVSKNGLLYDEALATSIEEQINTKRPGGIFGHLKDEERDTSFPIPPAMWVGAKRVGQSLWAKAYVAPGAARDHIRQLKAMGGSIATSIYGKGAFEAVEKGVRRLKDFDLESLDFAPPSRAALGYASAPNVTAELTQDDPVEEQEVMELTIKDVSQALREQIIQEFQAANNQQAQVAELTQQVTDRDTIITELRASVQQSQVREFDNALDAKIAELVNWQVKGEAAQAKVDAFKRTLKSRILAEMGTDRKAERIAEVTATVWADLKEIAETVRDALAGPAAIVGNRQRSTPKLEDTPENRQRAISEFGISI
jgi:hypothetical protein